LIDYCWKTIIKNADVFIFKILSDSEVEVRLAIRCIHCVIVSVTKPKKVEEDVDTVGRRGGEGRGGKGRGGRGLRSPLVLVQTIVAG
jgi:hypothetical protein